MEGAKKRGVWVITVVDKPPAERRGDPDPETVEAMKREGVRKPRRKQRHAKYIK